MAAHRHVVRISLPALLGSALVLACSSSSGPGDTTVALNVDEVTSPTNQLMPAITGTTDPGATVTVTSPVDTISGVASSSGAFSGTITLDANAMNQLTIMARDSAGNQKSETLGVLHDGIAPGIRIVDPAAGLVMPAQSGWPISVAYDDESSGVDLSALGITSDGAVGGAFNQDGTFATLYPAGTNLVALFTVAADTARTLVADTALFSAGTNRLTTRIADLAGNTASVFRSFEVTADPPKLIPVDAAGSAGSAGLPLTVGLANADSVKGVQFDLSYDTLVVASVDSVTAGDRASGFDSTPFNEISPGLVRVLLFDNGGAVIAPGQGPVLIVWITIAGGAASGAHSLSFSAITLSDPGGGTTPVSDATGELTVP